MAEEREQALQRVLKYLTLIEKGLKNAQQQSQNLSNQKTEHIAGMNKLDYNPDKCAALLQTIEAQLQLYARIERGITNFFRTMNSRESEFKKTDPEHAEVWDTLTTTGESVLGFVTNYIENLKEQKNTIQAFNAENYPTTIKEFDWLVSKENELLNNIKKIAQDKIGRDLEIMKKAGIFSIPLSIFDALLATWAGWNIGAILNLASSNAKATALDSLVIILTVLGAGVWFITKEN